MNAEQLRPLLRRPVGIRAARPLIALAGQPNVGKSTLFNLLTGLHQHVGNWPGKTVERRDGRFALDGRELDIVDLPGTYSLTANSPEEVIAREFLLHERPDLVIAVVNASSLERSLYLVAELLAVSTRVVIALNMMDVAVQAGLRVDAGLLERALGLPVVPVVASRTTGTRQLLTAVQETLDGGLLLGAHAPEIPHELRPAQEAIRARIAGHVPALYPAEWVALKLLEGDSEIAHQMQQALPTQTWDSLQEILAGHDDALLWIASGRYEWIGAVVRAAVTQPRLGQISWTQRLDRWAAHPLWGLLVLGGILGLVFWLTFALGAPVQGWLAIHVMGAATALIARALAGAPWWIEGLVVNGVLGGAGAVVTFLPIMMIFFAVFGLLEDTGYMARAAYVMDNLMHLMGLHGKSFLPLFLGFGCNVPAILGTRVIDSKPSRLLTILIAPFVPCSARMAVLAFLAPAFFGSSALIVSWSLVLVSMVILLLSGSVLNRLLFKGQHSAFIMEMPLYHLPDARTIGLLVWQRSLAFIQKAGTTILAMSVVIWTLSVLPGGNVHHSFLVQFGQFIEPVGRWMGFDWRLTVALITSFPAKENAIATLGALLGTNPSAGLAGTLRSTYSPASGLSFLVVTMLFLPCLATMAAIRQETNSWRWPLLSLGLFAGTSIAAGTLVYHVALAVGL